MPVVRIIPERTIDAWTCSAVLGREPRALVWAPTPPAQSRPGCQPWHLPIAAFDPPAKLLVLQNKALIGQAAPHCYPKVSVELAQLARLVDLEIAGLPVFYGLPGICDIDLPSASPEKDLGARAVLKLRPSFDRWQRLVRPLELFALRPVMKAIAADRQIMTLNSLALVGFPPLRAFLGDTRAGPWGKNLPTDSDGRAKSLMPSPRPDRVVREAVQKAACMGQASPSVLKQRLLDIYTQPEVRARMAGRRAEPDPVDVHLNRTIWLVLPADSREDSSKELALTGRTGS